MREFLLAFAEPRVAAAADGVAKAERWMRDHPGEDAQLRYADALARWGEAGGYEAEVVFDRCTHAAFGQGYPECAERRIETLSGGERKRLALEVVFGSPFDVILLDEPDNTLDIEGKRWLEDTVIASTARRSCSSSHDRTVLDRTASRIVTLEGKAAWTHPGRFSTYAEARDGRIDRLDEDHRRYDEERRRLAEMVKEMKRKAAYNDGWASKARNAEHRLERFEERDAPPEKPAVQDVRMRIGGGRTGKVALRIRGLAIAGHRAAVRRRDLVRRARGRDRPEREREDPLPAAPRRRGRRARGGVDARRAGRARAVRAAARAPRHRRAPDPRGPSQARPHDDRVDGRAPALRARRGGPEPVRRSCREGSRRGSSSC